MLVEARRCRWALEHLLQSGLAWPRLGCCHPPDIRSNAAKALVAVESQGCLRGFCSFDCFFIDRSLTFWTFALSHGGQRIDNRFNAGSLLSGRSPALILRSKPSVRRDLHADEAKIGQGPSELPNLSAREPRWREVLQRVWRAPRGADTHPRAARLHAAASCREDSCIPERAQGRAQAGHRPLRRRRALDGTRGARRSRGMASPARSPVPDPCGRRSPIRG